MLPALSHLQFITLCYLKQPQNAKTLRTVLEKEGIHQTAPAFYELIKRLTGKNWIRSEERLTEDSKHRENWYTTTKDGEQQIEEGRQFYQTYNQRTPNTGEIPKLSHLQYLILNQLDPEQCGKDIRHTLSKHGWNNGSPAFYQLMHRMEKKGWLTSQKRMGKDGHHYEQWYRTTKTGKQQVEMTRKFYTN